MQVAAEGRRHSPEWFYEQLNKTLKHGARAATLSQDAPDLVDALVSKGKYSHLTNLERATRAEEILRAAVTALGGEASDAVEVLLMLALGTLGTTIEVRQERAGNLYGGLSARGFRTDNNQGMLLRTLAVEVYKRVDTVCPLCGLPCDIDFAGA